MPANEASKWIASKKKEPITTINIDEHIYIDLRFLSYTWYNELALPNYLYTSYVIEGVYIKWRNVQHTSIKLFLPVTDEVYYVNNFFVYSFGSVKQFNSDTMVLVDKTFVYHNPSILPDKSRDNLLKRYEPFK